MRKTFVLGVIFLYLHVTLMRVSFVSAEDEIMDEDSDRSPPRPHHVLGRSKRETNSFWGNLFNFERKPKPERRISNETLNKMNEFSERNNRFLSLFTVVKFNNEACMSASGDNGTCFPQAECVRRGGASNGKCAQGYGSCCVFSKSCGASTNQNCTYFTHNGYPSSFDGSGSCQLTVYKCAPDICQLKLEFDSFNIAQPGSNGVCNNDQFIVSGTTTAVPITCGVNTGNHMFVDVGNDNSPVTLSVITSGPTFSRSWKIKVTQIKCNDAFRAPEGCLQYFRGVSGVIRSYNFDFTSGQQLSNQDYTTCIRQERNFCGIRYTACSDNGYPSGGDPARSRAFTLTGQLAQGGAGSVGAITGSSNCVTDWVTIPCATNTGRILQMNGAVCQDRLCGDIFNSEGGGASNQVPVYSYAKPFRITYHTDSNETNDSGNRGFCLNYIQQPCTPQQKK
ncbi:unnamed protein product [Allacma fusca]|uniref:CUB domain-containing protein n=1 Tax=Allacma fusca TaxID=39272 RepID=A0A8J2P499_9HEXA|nr:unnamed protein product [Allacma fusca]